MQQTVSLNKQEVNTAILEYAEKHGVRLDGMVATVEVMATRGDRELYATIALEPQKDINAGIEKIWISVEPVEEIRSIQDDIDEGVPVEATQEIDDDEEIFG